MAQILIALGGNLSFQGKKPQTILRRAIRNLEIALQTSAKNSNLYKTPAYPPDSGDDFVNMTIKITTTLSPINLLSLLHQIEQYHGRKRTQHWGARTVDMDIIAYDDLILPTENILRFWMNLDKKMQLKNAPKDLVLPHPRMHERAFVLVPLAEIAPQWRHPILNKTVSEMRNALRATEFPICEYVQC